MGRSHNYVQGEADRVNKGKSNLAKLKESIRGFQYGLIGVKNQLKHLNLDLSAVIPTDITFELGKEIEIQLNRPVTMKIKELNSEEVEG